MMHVKKNCFLRLIFTAWFVGKHTVNIFNNLYLSWTYQGFWHGASSEKGQPWIWSEYMWRNQLILCGAYSWLSHTVFFFFFYGVGVGGDDYIQYTVAIMGYGPEDKNTVLELTYNYGIREYDKGNGYIQVNFQPYL